MNDSIAQGTCPDCGGGLRLKDKHMFSGREIRVYECADCKKEMVRGGGTALLQVLRTVRERKQGVRPARVARPWWKIWG